MFKPSFWSNVRRAKAKKVDGDMKGDGFQMGGLIVVEPSGEIIYRFKQTQMGDHPPPEAVLEAAAKK